MHNHADLVSTPREHVTEATSDQKLAELLLIVANELTNEPAAGAVKVNKIMFFAEFAHVRKTGRPITGAEYQRLPQGPAARRLPPARRALIRAGRAHMEQEPFKGLAQHRLVVDGSPNWNLFSETEQEAIRVALQRYGSKTGTHLTDLSHDEPAWQLYEDLETIPFAMAFAPSAPPPEDVRARSRERLRERRMTRGR